MFATFLNGLIMLDIVTKIDDITAALAKIGRPVAVLALTIAILTYIAEPILPEFARENKGIIRRVLFALICLSLVPDIISFIAGS